MPDLIQEIKQRVALHEYMETSGIVFTSKSEDSWKARCWMHEDKTPSLVVSVRKGLFNCFSTGCEARGDVICFQEQFYSVDRSTAIKTLAGLCGARTEFSESNPIREIMERVTEECSIKALQTPKVDAYLKSRGVSTDTQIAFQVGYCPSAQWLKSTLSDLSPETLKSMELDSFKYRDALVLPCVDPITGMIAHYVRPFGKSSSKYMGPSGTNPTRWNGMMFGLQMATRFYREEKKLILVEGQFDCLALHSGGFHNTVCMLGSHLSADQVDVFKSLHIKHATILFDGDKAGDAGAGHAIGTTDGIRLSVAFLPGGDPDEYLAQEGPASLKRIIGSALLPVDYILHKYAGEVEDGSHEKAEGLKNCVTALGRLPYEDYLTGVKLLSEKSGIPAEYLLDLSQEEKPETAPIIESERQVLAHVIQNPSTVAFTNALPDNIWTLAKHKNLWGIITTLATKGVQSITTQLIDTRNGDKALTGTVDGLLALEVSNFDYHIGVIKEAHIRRTLKQAAKRLALHADNNKQRVEDVVSIHLQEMSQAASPTSKLEFTAGEVVTGAMDFIHERMADPDHLPGLDLGDKWKNTTKVLLGLQKNRLYLLGAGPKVGKTTLGLNWAVTTAVEKKLPVLWINLEMSERDIAIRCLAMLSGLSSLRVQAGRLATKEKEILDSKAAEFYASPFHVLNAFGMSVQEVIAAVRKYVYMHSIEVAFLDYIQLLNVSGEMKGADYWERHSFVSTQLKQAINANLNVPIVALSQLGRPAGRVDSSSGSFIGGSYKYVQDCDTFMGLRMRTDKEMEDGLGGNLVLNVEYNRHGPSQVYTRIHFNTDNLRMEELE